MSLDVVNMENGAPRETRTPDPLITNQTLYQLSYRGTWGGIYGPGTRRASPNSAIGAGQQGHGHKADQGDGQGGRGGA